MTFCLLSWLMESFQNGGSFKGNNLIVGRHILSSLRRETNMKVIVSICCLFIRLGYAPAVHAAGGKTLQACM